MLTEAIGDQKRLVRGWHWWRARYFLRARDGAHNKPWKLLTIAGPAPVEEVLCIKELMPRAHITAVDIKQDNVLAAIDAGVDDAHCLDIGDIRKEANPNSMYKYAREVLPYPLNEITGENKFDAICIDLTGPADDWLKKVVLNYFGILKARGVMIVTFCYGRDVVEQQNEEWRLALASDESTQFGDLATDHLNEVPDHIAPRVWYVLRSLSRKLDSCFQYRGHYHPMVSCLLVKKTSMPLARFLSVKKSDYDLICSEEDLSKVFACPIERITELRAGATRRLAAKKAAATKRRQLQRKMYDGPIITTTGTVLSDDDDSWPPLLEGPNDIDPSDIDREH